MLFEVKDVDRDYYEKELKDFLPPKMIDVHTHVWLKKVARTAARPQRTVTWPSRVADQSPVEELLQTYELMFPDKSVTPMIFATIPQDAEDLGASNRYISECAKQHDLPSLLWSDPNWSAEELERSILDGGFLGIKSYLSHAHESIPANEIRIFDYFPPHQLEVVDHHGWIAMIHIPRPARLRDPVNLWQMLEIEKRFPKAHVIYAHVGRAYCPEDLGDAFEVLKDSEHLVFDISANTCAFAFTELLRSLGPRRVLFGSDLPITRMRMRRVCENGTYVNIVPKGLYGDVSDDPHMRDADGTEAQALSFFMYEEIRAFKCAAEEVGLSSEDVEAIFYGNARRIIDAARSAN